MQIASTRSYTITLTEREADAIVRVLMSGQGEMYSRDSDEFKIADQFIDAVRNEAVGMPYGGIDPNEFVDDD